MELKNPFNTKAKLEIQVKGKYYKTTPTVFRSWHGKRRVDGKAYYGERFYFETNDLYGVPTNKVEVKPALKVRVIKPGKNIQKQYMLRTKHNTHRVVTVK